MTPGREEKEKQFPQLVGQFLVDRDGIIRWVNIEAAEGRPASASSRADEEFLAAAARLEKQPLVEPASRPATRRSGAGLHPPGDPPRGPGLAGGLQGPEPAPAGALPRPLLSVLPAGDRPARPHRGQARGGRRPDARRRGDAARPGAPLLPVSPGGAAGARRRPRAGDPRAFRVPRYPETPEILDAIQAVWTDVQGELPAPTPVSRGGERAPTRRTGCEFTAADGGRKRSSRLPTVVSGTVSPSSHWASS